MNHVIRMINGLIRTKILEEVSDTIVVKGFRVLAIGKERQLENMKSAKLPPISKYKRNALEKAQEFFII